MPKNNHPADYAVTIAGDEDRTHYFDDREEFNDFIRGLLVGEDESRISPTDFKLYRKATDAWWEWEEQGFDPYDYFTDIDDTPYPVAHGQLLGNYSDEVDHKTLWDIAQGREDLISLIPSATTRYRVEQVVNRLKEVGVWDAPEVEDTTAEELYALATQGTSFIDEDEPEYWLTEI